MTPIDQDATYRAALELVAQIDKHLTRGTGHYYTKSGLLLYSLDQVTNAILTDTLEVTDAHNNHFRHFSQSHNLLLPLQAL